MIKKITVLPFLFLAFAFNSCNFTESTAGSGEPRAMVPIEYNSSKQEVEAALGEIYPAEEVGISYGVQFDSGQSKVYFISVEFTDPETLPGNDNLLAEKISDIRAEFDASIANVEEYQQLVILFQQKSEKNGLERIQSVKKIVELR